MIIGTILLFVISFWQLYSTVKAFKYFKTEGGSSTSHFIMLSLFGSLVIGIGCLVGGIYVITLMF